MGGVMGTCCRRPYEGDGDALMDFYYKAKGYRWRASENWGTGKRLELWTGVRCIKEEKEILQVLKYELGEGIYSHPHLCQHVVEVKLPFNEVSGDCAGILPPLQSLQKLRSIRLYSNNISGSLPRN